MYSSNLSVLDAGILTIQLEQDLSLLPDPSLLNDSMLPELVGRIVLIVLDSLIWTFFDSCSNSCSFM